MRARDIIGKTVQSVLLERSTETICCQGGGHGHIREITFTDGSRLVFRVHEGEADYGVVPTLVRLNGGSRV